MENKNQYVRKPKLAEQIDPLLAREYEKLAVDKARSLINRPDHEISLTPIQDLVPISSPDVYQIRSRTNGENYKNNFVNMPGTTKAFIGDGDGAVIQSADFEEIKRLEESAINESGSSDYINGLPERKVDEPINLEKFRQQLRDKKSNGTADNNTDGPDAA